MELNFKITVTLPDEMSEASANLLDSYFRPLLKEIAGKQNEPVADEPAEVQTPSAKNVDTTTGETAQTAEEDDDLPYSVSNEDLREAVKVARTKVGSQAVWNLFAKYGINASIDCPDEKRPQFYADLKSLAA